MKLFDEFEAIKFPEENLIFITRNRFLYYIYNIGSKWWRKHDNAGNDSITVSNYQDISKEELMDAMDGVLPDKETDFMRLCNPAQLCIRDMLDLLEEDYPEYMSVDAEHAIFHAVHRFLLESDIHHTSYLKLKELFDNALINKQSYEQVLMHIKNLSFAVTGRDIYKEEIRIIDGHNSSSYFWIMPVKVVDYTDTADPDAVAEMRSVEISIEEDDVHKYLVPFLFKHFDNEIEANKNRADMFWAADNGDKQTTYVEGFEWYLTYNFYTHDSIKKILKDIRDTMEALSLGKENEFIDQIKERRGFATYRSLYEIASDEDLLEEVDSSKQDDNTKIEQIIDFYRRFIYRMEYMMTVGQENGYDLISFMGP